MLTDLDEEQASSDDQDVRAETSNDGTGAKKRVPGDGRPPAAAEPDAASSRRGAASVQDAAQGEDKVSETMIAALKYQSRAAPLIPQALTPCHAATPVSFSLPHDVLHCSTAWTRPSHSPPGTAGPDCYS